jgi:hypothetical protein
MNQLNGMMLKPENKVISMLILTKIFPPVLET